MSEDGESTENNWKGFSEMYILKHMYSERIKEYKKLEPAYEKIKDLCAKADNLNVQVQLFYRNLHAETLINNSDQIDLYYQKNNKLLVDGFLSQQKNKLLINKFLLRVGKEEIYVFDIYFYFKQLLANIEKVNKHLLYESDKNEIENVYNKYKKLFFNNEDNVEIKKFFSSITNFVHFIKESRKLIKTLKTLADNYKIYDQFQYNARVKKITDIIHQIIGDASDEKFNSFSIWFVDCLDTIKDVLKKNNTNFNNSDISNLKAIYEKYKTYTERFFVTTDLKKMIDVGFVDDFQTAAKILVMNNNVFNECVKSFNGLLEFYEKNFKSSSNLYKFIEFGIEKSYFSDEQICKLYNIKLTDNVDLITYVPKFIIKKFPVIASSADNEKLR